ncbi:hypothetical protein HYQ46_008821 [Verticillium longisporum]|nr:hypothetical protein HYQ46_008821 [Verticillium longisporum]
MYPTPQAVHLPYRSRPGAHTCQRRIWNLALRRRNVGEWSVFEEVAGALGPHPWRKSIRALEAKPAAMDASQVAQCFLFGAKTILQ